MAIKDYKDNFIQPRSSLFTPIPNVPYKPSDSNVWPSGNDKLFTQIEKIWNIADDKPLLQTWAISHFNKLSCAVNCYTGLYISGIFKRSFNLRISGIVNANILCPSILGSFLFNLFYHAKEVTVPMALNPWDDHASLILNQGGFHLLTSCFYQTFFISVSSVFHANRFNTFPIPDDFVTNSISRKYVKDCILMELRKNRRSFLGLVVLNTVFSLGLTKMESYQIKQLADQI